MNATDFLSVHLDGGAIGRRLANEARSEAPMPHSTENPYDRRQHDARPNRRGFDGEANAAGEYFPELRGAPLVPRALAIEDIEALVHSAHVRGQQSATAHLEKRHREAIGHSCRVAWDEGHAAGHLAGREALLREIAVQHEAAVDHQIGRISDALARHGKGDRTVTKALLAAQLQEAFSLLAQLRDSHHQGFVQPIPF